MSTVRKTINASVETAIGSVAEHVKACGAASDRDKGIAIHALLMVAGAELAAIVGREAATAAVAEVTELVKNGPPIRDAAPQAQPAAAQITRPLDMTPAQAVKWLVVVKDAVWSGKVLPADITGAMVDELYDELVAAGEHWDAKNEVRCGEVETSLPAPDSRNYESKAVAAQLPSGQWVGWTYWYGGGKHADPEAIEWMEHAYWLNCAEEQQTVTVRTFTLATPS